MPVSPTRQPRIQQALSRGASVGSAVSPRGPGQSQLSLSCHCLGGERPRAGPAVATSEALAVTFFQATEPGTQADAGTGPLRWTRVLAESSPDAEPQGLGPARVWRGLSGGAVASGGVRVRRCGTDLTLTVVPGAHVADSRPCPGGRGPAMPAAVRGSLRLRPALPAARPSSPNARTGRQLLGVPRISCSRPVGLAFMLSPQAGPSGDTQGTPALTLARHSSVWPCMTL